MGQFAMITRRGVTSTLFPSGLPIIKKENRNNFLECNTALCIKDVRQNNKEYAGVNALLYIVRHKPAHHENDRKDANHPSLLHGHSVRE